MSEQSVAETLEEDLSSLKSLTTSAGWGLIKTVLESQIEVRRNLEDAHEIEDFFKDTLDLQRLKAERRALMLVIGLPDTMIEQLEEDINQYHEDEEHGTRGEFED